MVCGKFGLILGRRNITLVELFTVCFYFVVWVKCLFFFSFDYSVFYFAGFLVLMAAVRTNVVQYGFINLKLY